MATPAKISQALRLAVRFSLHTDSATNLRATLESRTVIDMAIGIVMAQNRCSQETAVQILTDASSNGNVKLRDIATSLVESVGGSAYPDPLPGTGAAGRRIIRGDLCPPHPAVTLSEVEPSAIDTFLWSTYGPLS